MYGNLKKLFSVLILTGIVLVFSSPSFAEAISPSSVEWDNTDGKAKSLVFEVVGVGDVTALEFVKGSLRVIFSKDEFTFDCGKLTILNTALAKTPNGTYTMKAATANAYKETVTFSKPVSVDMTFVLPNFTGANSLTFKPATGMIYFDPSEFSFDNTTKTLTIKKEALTKIDAGIYEMKVTENIGEETAEVVIKGNLEKQKEEEKQEEQKHEEEKNISGNSGGGCNAGFGAFALLSVLGVLVKFLASKFAQYKRVVTILILLFFIFSMVFPTFAMSIAIGDGQIITGDNSGAFGYSNIVAGNGSYAVGNNNTVMTDDTLVLGSSVTITANNSVILGSESEAVEGNTISVGYVGGERKIVNVKAGENVTDAVNYGQMKDYVATHGGSGGDDPNAVHYNADKSEIALKGTEGTIISRVKAVEPAESGAYAATTGQLYVTNQSIQAEVQTRVTENARVLNEARCYTDTSIQAETDRAQTVERHLQNEINANTNEIREVGAISAALAGLHYVEPSGEEGDKFVGAVAYGNYRGESAGAIGVAYKPNPNFMFSASTSVGQNQNAYNAGMSLKFGRGETAQTRAELKKQVQYLNEQNQAQNERIAKQDSENAALKGEIEALKNDNEAMKKENAEIKEMLKKLIKK